MFAHIFAWYTVSMNMKKQSNFKYFVLFTAAALLLAACLFPAPKSLAEERLWDVEEDGGVPEATPAPDYAPMPAASAARGEHAENLYEAELHVARDAKSLSGKLRFTYTNRTADVLYVIKLRLHANDVAPGSLKVNSVSVNGERSYYTLDGEKESMLTVPLPLEIKNGEEAEIFLTFDLTFPETGNRFGINTTGVMLGNFLPIAAVYEDGAWRNDRYIDEGDAFFSETADYRIVLTYPDDHTVAHTGSMLEERQDNVYEKSRYITASRSRDFALALIPDGETASAEALNGRVGVRAVTANEKTAAFAAEAAAKAIDFFSTKIGLYPYTDFAVVPFDRTGGMEYPGLVMVSERYFRDSYREMGELVIFHEAAHQWFYALVGSDQINAPWLDESLVEFLGFRCYAELYGEEVAEKLWQERFIDYPGTRRTARLDADLYAFEHDGYFMTVYAHGAALYRALYEELGEDTFYGALRIYFDANSFSVADMDDLIAAFEEASGRDLTAWFEERMAAEYRF